MKSIIYILAFVFFYTGLTAQVKNENGFSESELILKTKTGEIFGTLTIPANAPKTPVVVIIPGSGPTDRDGNSPLVLQTNAYKMLAAGLAKYGISTLRFDKRGIAESKAAMTSESDLRFENYVKDVIDWISLLKADKRFSGIYLLGHSEGSLIGILAAQKAGVSGLISLAGAGKPADEVLREQLKDKLPPQDLLESNRILDSLRKGVQLYPSGMNLHALFRPGIQPYLISWIKYNPSKEISKLKVPVLIIQGTTDLQVSTGNAQLLRKANPAAKLKIFENMNHVLKESSSNLLANQATYNNPTLPLKTGLVDEICRFVKKNR